ncbi:DUF115 domain-containing protein [bacterium]|nr:DUF115 domain-containing protein [bacterium]
MKNKARLEDWRDRYAGERCFIVGNGPSLRNTDLSKLEGEFTFGMNRIYLAFEEYNFKTSCLVSVNDLVLEQCHQDIAALELPKFVTWRARRFFAAGPDMMFLDTDYTLPEAFNGDATGRLFEGFTVTYVCLQLAYFMGFNEAILIGVDHNFVTKGPANATVTSEGDDPNHFSAKYFGKGFRWQLPDLEGSERAYRMAREAYEADGRQVVDGTVGGKLTVFPKVDYEGLF